MNYLRNLAGQLSAEQLKHYQSIIDSYDYYHSWTDTQKERLIRSILCRPYMNLLCDWAFKHVFGHDKEALMMLLRDFLPLNIVDISYESNEADRFTAEEKDATMDVVCTLADGRFVIVEMQTEYKTDFHDRMFYYGASNITAPVRRGGPYSAMCPVYILCFCNFTMKHTICPPNKMSFVYELREAETGEVYGDHAYLYYCICELPRLTKTEMSEMDPIEEWFHIFRNISNFALQPAGVSKRFEGILAAARMSGITDEDKTNYLKGMLTDYDKHMLQEGGYKRGFDDGIEKGMDRKARDTAERMLAEGFNKETIARLTGLSEEQIP